MRNRALTFTASLGAVSLVVAACAPDDETEPQSQETVTETAEADQDTETAEPEETQTVTETPEQGDDSEQDQPDPEEMPGERVPPGGTEQVPDDELAGDEFEMYHSEGDELGVAGLDPQEAPLEVYATPAPDGDAEVVGELESTDAVTVTGRQRNDADDEDFGIWSEVQLADGYGWVEGGLFFFGETEDITDEYIDEVPPAEDPQTIAEGVAERAIGERETRTDEDGEEHGPESTLITTPEDYGEDFYRLDVLGMMDNSLAGYRLFVTVEDAGDGYQLAQVERTMICLRGVSENGLCS